jgi:hypothetical protein
MLGVTAMVRQTHDRNERAQLSSTGSKAWFTHDIDEPCTSTNNTTQEPRHDHNGGVAHFHSDTRETSCIGGRSARRHGAGIGIDIIRQQDDDIDK